MGEGRNGERDKGVPWEIVVDMAEAMGGKGQNEKNDEESGYGMEIVFILSRAI